MRLLVVLGLLAQACSAFVLLSRAAGAGESYSAPKRALGGLGGGLLKTGPWAAGALALAARASAATAGGGGGGGDGGETNEVIETINGVRQKRLGGGEIVVSEIGLGTQRWVSEDLNAPSEVECFALMDEAVLNSGVSLIDTASQYPIPSSPKRPEGLCEEVIGRWMKSRNARDKCKIATKIVGSSHVNRKTIVADCDSSLKRLQTDHLDIYLLHWPARYSPACNWGQSLAYHKDAEEFYEGNASFEEIVSSMGALIKAGKIRGYGFCNDNCFGLTAAHYTAKMLGVDPPCVMQGDYSLIDRKFEENGLAEASSSVNLNAGWMAYNVLAGGQLTGKYLTQDASGSGSGPGSVASFLKDKIFSKRNGEWTDPSMATSFRGRFDERGWGRTLYRYRSGPALEATKSYAQLAKRFGLSLTEMAIRWTLQQPQVTTSLLGVSNMKQLKENLSYAANKEPLPEELMVLIDRVHMVNRNPIYASTGPYADNPYTGLIGERIP